MYKQPSVDPTLLNYMNTLQIQAKFKAKIIYTLACIRNYLAACSQSNYKSNVQYLCQQKPMTQLLHLIKMHPDCAVLQPISCLFVQIQKSTLNPTTSIQLLNVILSITLQSELTTVFVQNVCLLLNLLNHLYPHTKKLCMNLLAVKNITKIQSKMLMDILRTKCVLSLQQSCLVGEKGNVAVDEMLKIMWKINATTYNGANKDIENIINKYLDQNWWDDRTKYMCSAIAIANATNQQGVTRQITPSFINKFYKTNPKPFYLFTSPNVKLQQFSKNFANIMSYVSSQLLSCDPPTCPAFIKQLSTIFPQQFNSNTDFTQILSALFQNRIPINNLQHKNYQIIPLKAITVKDNNLIDLSVKFNQQMTLQNAYYVLQKLLENVKLQATKPSQIQWRIYQQLLMVRLKNKQHLYLKQIDNLIKYSIQQRLNLFHHLISCNLYRVTFLPIILQNYNSFDSYPKDKIDYLYKSIDKYMNNQGTHLSAKFFVAQKLIKMRYLPGVSKFVYFLLRKLTKQQKIGFQEIAYYMKHGNLNEQDILWINANFQEQLQSILEKVFAQLVDIDFKAPKSIIFALQKYQAFSEWSQLYRWTLNPLDQPNFNNSQVIVDSLEVLQTVIQNCKNVPLQLIKKFFHIVTKNWDNFDHNHMFTIQRISNTLFSQQQLSSQDLQQISLYLKSLPTSRNFSKSNKQIYICSLSLMISSTLLQQTEDIDTQLVKLITTNLSTLNIESSFKNYQNMKDILFTLQVLMWRFQYEEQVIHDKVAQGLVKILNNYSHLQIASEQDREKLVQACLQVLSSVGHNCNLLDIGLGKILTSYITSLRIVEIATQIITSVKQVNLKAIGKFKLQRLIPILLSSLLITDSKDLTNAHINLLTQLINPQTSSPYSSIISKNYFPFIQIIRIQAIFVTNKYSPQLVKFALEWIKNLGITQKLSKKWVEILWVKYWYEQQIRTSCQQIIGNLGAKKAILQSKFKQPQIQQLQVKKEEVKIQNKEENNQNNQKLTQPQKQVQQQIIINQSKNTSIKPIEQEYKKQQPKKQSKQQQQQQIIKQQYKLPLKKKKQLEVNFNEQKQVLKTSKFTTPRINNLSLSQTSEAQGQNKNPPAQFKPPTLKPKSQSPFPTGFGSNGAGSGKKKRTERAVQRDEQVQNINKIKQHVTYIGTLADCKVNQTQLTKLKESIKYLTQVVQVHQYYCQKIVNFGIVSKCLALHADTQKIILQDMLQLFQCISQRKQKNLLIFNDNNSINFFKTTLKNSLLVQKQLPTTSQIINIINNCWSSSSQFFSSGLISMLLQMAKVSLNRFQILELLSSPSNKLSHQIVNQIYQRGLLNVMENTIKIKIQQMQDRDKIQLIQWARLIGKVCVNNSIREKLWGIALHSKMWEKKRVFEQKGCPQSLAFFFASFCYQFQRLCFWCIQQKIPQYFLSILQRYEALTPIEFYKFYRYFAQNGVQLVEHLFRIQFHTYLISILPILQTKVKNQGAKHYYKCLAHMFTPQRYQIFIKAELIKTLINKYHDEHSFLILECLQKLIAQIKQKKELQVLQKQQFYTINKVFNSKIKDDLSYPYILQVYKKLLKKFKKFQSKHLNLDLVHQIIRKAIYSINMQGKKKTIEFIIQFSQIDKVYYGNANVMVLLQSLLSYNTGEEQLQLFLTYLIIQDKYKKPQRISQQARNQQQQKFPMRFKNIVSIPCQDLLNIILIKYLDLKTQIEENQSLTKNNLKLMSVIIQILKYFKMNQNNSITIFQKIGALILRQNKGIIKIDDSLKLVNQLLSWKTIQNRFQGLSDSLVNYLKMAAEYLSQASNTKAQLIQVYTSILDKCLKSNIIYHQQFKKFCNNILQKQKVASSEPIKKFLKFSTDYKSSNQITQIIKQKMKTGIKVRLYKPDGSNSQLLLFITDDLFEIHCVANLGQPVKSKWKMGLNEIIKIQEYHSQQAYKNSVFYLSEGIFSKAPPMSNCLALEGKSKNFYISFDTTVQLNQWKRYFQLTKSRAIQILMKVS